MSKSKFFSIATILAASLISIADATPVTLVYTGDNIIQSLTLVNGGFTNYTPGPNYADWKTADSLALDLEAGDYSLVFQVSNAPCNCTNPAALLAEISGVGVTGDLTTGNSWQYAMSSEAPFDSLDVFTSMQWLPVTSYGNNGGPNIWTTYGPGPISGISSDAAWIWSRSLDFALPQHESLYLRGDFAVTGTGLDTSLRHAASVPEPPTLLLIIAGILVIASRKLVISSD